MDSFRRDIYEEHRFSSFVLLIFFIKHFFTPFKNFYCHQGLTALGKLRERHSKLKLPSVC